MDHSAGDGPEPPSPWRRAITVLCVITMCALVGAAKCAEDKQPKETVESLRAKSPTLQKPRLRIGVRADLRHIGYEDPDTKERSGFEVAIAIAMAGDLGYPEGRFELVTVGTVQQRLSDLQRGNVDMVVASLSDTPARRERVNFAGPYMIVPQRVMVPIGNPHALNGVGDLQKPEVTVCVGAGTTSMRALEGKAHLDPVDENTACIAGLKSGRYQAYSADLPILASFVADNPGAFEILPFTIVEEEEYISIAVPKGDPAMRDLVAYFLDRWRKEGAASPWQHAYHRTIGRHLQDSRYATQPPVIDPPDLVDHDDKATR